MKRKKIAGIRLLTGSKTDYPDSPNKARIESFSNKYSGRDYEIVFNCPEFTSLCPVTGQPDFGEITIKYVPGKKCVESKSLKLFLHSFRNHGSFHEEVVNMIADKIIASVSPRKLEISGLFRPRGGISINVKYIYEPVRSNKQ
jgi:7-cyano-7-deazaguanine reductase